MSAATVTIEGKRFVILPENEYERLRGGQTTEESGLPPLPRPLANGNYPAIEYARAVTARDGWRAMTGFCWGVLKGRGRSAAANAGRSPSSLDTGTVGVENDCTFRTGMKPAQSQRPVMSSV